MFIGSTLDQQVKKGPHSISWKTKNHPGCYQEWRRPGQDSEQWCETQLFWDNFQSSESCLSTIKIPSSQCLQSILLLCIIYRRMLQGSCSCLYHNCVLFKERKKSNAWKLCWCWHLSGVWICYPVINAIHGTLDGFVKDTQVHSEAVETSQTSAIIPYNVPLKYQTKLEYVQNLLGKRTFLGI